jgi:hypothetical protein
VRVPGTWLILELSGAWLAEVNETILGDEKKFGKSEVQNILCGTTSHTLPIKFLM